MFAVVEALEADVAALAGLGFDALSERDCVVVCERLNRVARRIPGAQYELVNQLAERAVACDIGGPLARVLADRLSIRPGAARRLINDAEQLGHRRALCGERLAPRWPATAAQVRAGAIGAEHVGVIRDFLTSCRGVSAWRSASAPRRCWGRWRLSCARISCRRPPSGWPR